ncbi:MAG: hypothetical protein AAF579_06645 [Cyanobacteria bacterium P01_C01_bin.118]
MDSWLYLLKIAIASAIIGALIKWAGPLLYLPESMALIVVLLPTVIVGGWLMRQL